MNWLAYTMKLWLYFFFPMFETNIIQYDELLCIGYKIKLCQFSSWTTRDAVIQFAISGYHILNESDWDHRTQRSNNMLWKCLLRSSMQFYYLSDVWHQVIWYHYFSEYTNHFANLCFVKVGATEILDVKKPRQNPENLRNKNQ